MPQMGVSVSEGTVTRWLKQIGDTVAFDESLLEISTDKVDTEIPSPGEGIVAEIFVQEGQTVDVGTVLAVIGAAGAAASPQPELELEPEVVVSSTPVDAPVTATPAPPAPLSLEVAPEPEPVAAEGNGRSFVSPVVARIAAEHGVDPGRISGTGTGGRVTKKDILGFIESGAAAPPPPVMAPPAVAPAAETPPQPVPVLSPEPVVVAAPAPAFTTPPVATPPAPAVAPPLPTPVAAAPVEPQAGESVEPMSAMRRGVAEHMRRSLDISAHVTSAIEVDMSKVVAAREQLKKEYQAAYGVNPTYLAFIGRATIDTLWTGLVPPGQRDVPFRIAFCSSAHGEGTTTLAACAAIGIALHLRENVVLIEANGYTPGLARQLGLSAGPGFDEVLLGKKSLEASLHETSCQASPSLTR